MYNFGFILGMEFFNGLNSDILFLRSVFNCVNLLILRMMYSGTGSILYVIC